MKCDKIRRYDELQFQQFLTKAPTIYLRTEQLSADAQ